MRNRISLKFIATLALVFAFATFAFADEKKKTKKTTGTLKITTEQGSYPVYVDGQFIGNSSPNEAVMDVQTGTRTVEVRFPNGKSFTKSYPFTTTQPVCICFKKITRSINTPCPHLVQVGAPDVVTDGDLVTFTSNVDVAPNPKNSTPAMVNYNDFLNIPRLTTRLRDQRDPVAQCVRARFSSRIISLLEKDFTHSGSTTFTANDFANAQLLALKLRAGNEPLTKFLKNSLSSSTRKMLSGYDGSSALSSELLTALATDFNNIISGGSIYATDRFVGIVLSGESKEMLNRTLNASEVRTLNRMLLEDAFPTEIKRMGGNDADNLELGNALADEFNLLIKGPSLRNESCFSGVQMSEITKKASGQSFNRLLLEDAFAGEIVKIGTAYGQSNTPVRYKWTVVPSNARIVGPSDRDSIIVDTTGLGNQLVSATVTIDDGREDNLCRQNNMASTKVKPIPPPIPPRRFVEFPSVAFDDDKANFDAYAIELQNNPTWKGYVIIYKGTKSNQAKFDKLSARTIDYIIKTRGIPADRIVVLNGGTRDSDYFELWTVPEGATPPTPNMK